MHYGVLVILDEPTADVEAAVAAALAPFGSERGGRWDWYQVGGRWTGTFDGYDPNTDPALLKVCDMCGGTGDRATWRREPKENQHPTGCNGCLGKGKATAWPTQWPTRAEDAIPVAALTQAVIDGHVHAVVEGGSWHENERYTPWTEEKFTKQPLPTADYLKTTYPEGVAVIVDCHN